MGLFQPDNGPFLIERRKARRSRATCAASLRTIEGESFGELWDLSETGARISVANPPERGESALLKWAGEQVMCHLVWTEGDMCGVSFQSPISAAIVSSTARMLGIVEHPTAAIGNIPVGRKRSAQAAAGAYADQGGLANPLASRSRPEAAVEAGAEEPLTAEEKEFLAGASFTRQQTDPAQDGTSAEG